MTCKQKCLQVNEGKAPNGSTLYNGVCLGNAANEECMLHKPYGNLDEVKLIDCSGCEGEAEDLSKTSNLNIGDCPYVCNTCGGEPCQGYCTSDNKCVDKYQPSSSNCTRCGRDIFRTVVTGQWYQITYDQLFKQIRRPFTYDVDGVTKSGTKYSLYNTIGTVEIDFDSSSKFTCTHSGSGCNPAQVLYGRLPVLSQSQIAYIIKNIATTDMAIIRLTRKNLPTQFYVSFFPKNIVRDSTDEENIAGIGSTISFQNQTVLASIVDSKYGSAIDLNSFMTNEIMNDQAVFKDTTYTESGTVVNLSDVFNEDRNNYRTI